MKTSIPANTISEWSIQYEKMQSSLKLIKDAAKLSEGNIKVKEYAGTYVVIVMKKSVIISKQTYGIVYDRFNNPEFRSWYS